MKLSGLEKAVKEFKKFENNDDFYPVLMFDTDDGTVWCDVVENGHWQEYHQKTIYKMSTMNLCYRYDSVNEESVEQEIKSQCEESEIPNEFEF